jgi:segregation and condensation protein A
VFEIRLPAFEGPLDLLLYLLEKEELDITSISLVQVTDQYLSHLHSLETINMDALADFVAVGAKLLLLKSRALLPQEPGAAEEGEEEEDVGEELARLLIEYRRFKEAAAALRQREDQGLRSYPRLGLPPEVPLSLGLDRVTLRKLTRIFREALRRLPPEEEAGTIDRQEVSIQEKAEEILAALAQKGRLSFRRLVSTCRSRLEVVLSFLAVLELIKAQRVVAEQERLFGDIRLLPLDIAQPTTA